MAIEEDSSAFHSLQLEWKSVDRIHSPFLNNNPKVHKKYRKVIQFLNYAVHESFRKRLSTESNGKYLLSLLAQGSGGKAGEQHGRPRNGSRYGHTCGKTRRAALPESAPPTALHMHRVVNGTRYGTYRNRILKYANVKPRLFHIVRWEKC